MVPSFFVYVDQIPLTPNGKIDYRSLSARVNSSNKTASYILPINNIQFSLAKIWEKILKIENIGIDHNFFEIGGNSLLAIKLASHIHKHFSKAISVADIFRYPSIYSLSLLLESTEKSSNSPLILIKEGDEGAPLFMIHPGGGLAFCYMGLAHYVNAPHPIYGINNPQFNDPENGFDSLEEIAEFYVKLIKTIQVTGPYYLGGWSFGGLIAFEMAQQLHLQNEVVKNLILIDVDTPKKSEKKIKREKIVEINKKKDEDVLLQKVIGITIIRTIDKNIELLDKKVKKYDLKKYKGKVVLLRAANNYKFKITISSWKRYIDNLDIIDVPGAHTTLFDPDYIQSTAAAIKRVLF